MEDSTSSSSHRSWFESHLTLLTVMMFFVSVTAVAAIILVGKNYYANIQVNADQLNSLAATQPGISSYSLATPICTTQPADSETSQDCVSLTEGDSTVPPVTPN